VQFVFLLVGPVLLSGVVGLIIGVIALRQVGKSQALLQDLQRRLDRLEAVGGTGTVGHAPSAPAVTPQPGPTPAAASALPLQPSAARSAAAPRDLEAVVGSQWLTWLGIVAVFLGTAFFLAVDLGRSPLAGVFQVLAGFVVGIGFVVTGRLLSGRIHDVLGQGLLGAGVALLFLAAYGAYGFHQLVPAPVVYLFLLGVAVAGALLALQRESYAVALLTAGGALLAPGLLKAPGDPAGALFPYLLALSLGGAIVVARRPWALVPLALLAGTALLLTGWWTEHFTPAARGPVLLVCLLLWLLHAGLPLVARRGPRPWGVSRTLVLTGAGLLLTLMLYCWFAPELTVLRGTALALLALVHVGGARLAASRGRGGPAASLIHYTGLAIAVIAVPVQLDLAWVTLAWALLGLILVAGGLRFASPAHRLAGLLVTALAVCRVLVPDTVGSFRSPGTFRLVGNSEFLAGIATVAVLGLTARLLLRNRARLVDWEGRLPTLLIVGAAVLLLWRVSTESVAWFGARAEALHRSMRRPSLLTLSLIWVAYAGILILAGFLARYRPIRLLGVAVLGLLALKMLTLDLSVLEAGYRIASFLGVGIVLLAISVLYQRERRT